jgi:glutaminyl-tRNA synthetase
MIRCEKVVKDPASDEPVELRCTYDPSSLGRSPDVRRRKTTAIQWVTGRYATRAEVRLYGRLFTEADPEEAAEGRTFRDFLNPGSVEVLRGCLLEPGMAKAPAGERFQFVRHGYFIEDAADSRPASPVFLRIVELKDTYRGDGQPGKAAAAPKAAKPPAKPAAGKGKATGAGPVSEERLRARANDPSLSRRYGEYVATLGLSPEVADVLTGDAEIAGFFDAAAAAHPNAKAIANWVANDVLRELKGRSIASLPFGPGELADLARLVDRGVVTITAARTVFERMMASGGKPAELVRQLGLDRALSAAELEKTVDAVLAAVPDKVAAYRTGKTALLGMFTGQVMRDTGGKADPKAIQEMLRKKLE